VEGMEKPPYYDLKAATKVLRKYGLQQFQMEGCQPIKRLKDKKKKRKIKNK
jgi:hypothetical protein